MMRKVQRICGGVKVSAWSTQRHGARNRTHEDADRSEGKDPVELTPIVHRRDLEGSVDVQEALLGSVPCSRVVGSPAPGREEAEKVSSARGSFSQRTQIGADARTHTLKPKCANTMTNSPKVTTCRIKPTSIIFSPKLAMSPPLADMPPAPP